MIDLLVSAPSREALIALGVATGFLPLEVEQTGEVPYFANPLNIHEYGAHAYNAGTDEDPEVVEVEGYWVMLRAPDDTPIPDELMPMIVDRNPSDPTIPNRVWA